MDILVVLSDGFEADLERAQGSSKSAAKGIIYIFATWVHFAPSSFHIWFHHTGHQFSKIQIVGMKRNLVSLLHLKNSFLSNLQMYHLVSLLKILYLSMVRKFHVSSMKGNLKIK